MGSACTAGFYYGPKTEESVCAHASTRDPDSESVGYGKISHTDNPMMVTERPSVSLDMEDTHNEQTTTQDPFVALLSSDVLDPSRQNGSSMGEEAMHIGEKAPSEELEGSDEEEAEEEEDGGEWITPQNIDKIKVKHGLSNMAGVCKEIEVACMTTDFAMQVSRIV